MNHEVEQPKSHAQQSKAWGWLFKLLMLFMLLGLGVAVYAYIQYKTFIEAPISKQNTVLHLHVQSGSSAHRVAQQLHEQGFMSEPKWFVLYLRYLKKHHIIKAGEFEIQPHWTVDELIQALEKAKNIQYPVTIIAGHTFKQTIETIQALPKIKKVLNADDAKAIQAVFGIKGEISIKYPFAHLEGQFLPETYYYQRGDSDKDILMRAHQALKQSLEKAWKNRAQNLPYKNQYEALIMASIVEKETGYEPERPLIAGVFVRRLNKGMRLQTDPTVIYGIGAGYDGNIRRKDLRAKTPYNTYTINRLPPTPIAMASADAIQAVLNPAQTKALYFVAKGGGQHYFSKTLAEHNRAVRKYLLNK